MITRHDSLNEALRHAEGGASSAVRTIVFSSRWWNELSHAERDTFRKRAERLAITLRGDSQLVGHYVEMRGDDGPPLSSEQKV